MGFVDELKDARVAIIGLGLMGGSLAMALRGKCISLLGIDPDSQACNLALQRAVVDAVSVEAGDLLPRADLIVLAAPVGIILRLIADLPSLHPGEAVVMDLGSTKTEVLRAMETLPNRFEPIGGHPMCGKEKSSLAFADPAIFQDAPFALTPLFRTGRRAHRLAEEVVRAVGAYPLWLDALTHDRWTAATSHFPYLAANALAALVPAEARPLARTGFGSTARLAGSSIAMMMDIFKTNGNNVISILEKYSQEMELLRTCLVTQDWVLLQKHLEGGREQYHFLTNQINEEAHHVG